LPAGRDAQARNESNRTDAHPVLRSRRRYSIRTIRATARNLAARVSASGVLVEAHVAQSVRGKRSSDGLQDEAQQLARTLVGDPARSEHAPPRNCTRCRAKPSC